MNLQSKFVNVIIAETLNVSLCLQEGRNNGQPDKTDGRSDDQMPQADLSGQGHKK